MQNPWTWFHLLLPHLLFSHFLLSSTRDDRYHYRPPTHLYPTNPSKNGTQNGVGVSRNPKGPLQTVSGLEGNILICPVLFSKLTQSCSIEGVWEGFFTVNSVFRLRQVFSNSKYKYTEFTAYAAMLAGASPTVIQKGVVGRHQQTWKLREHHLLPFDHSDSDSGIDMDADSVTPLHAGDPLRSYFPIGTQIREHREGLTVQGSGSPHIRRYLRASALETQANPEDRPPCVQDIIITGEVSLRL